MIIKNGMFLKCVSEPWKDKQGNVRQQYNGALIDEHGDYYKIRFAEMFEATPGEKIDVAVSAEISRLDGSVILREIV